jgi:hypothetical protein
MSQALPNTLCLGLRSAADQHAQHLCAGEGVDALYTPSKEYKATRSRYSSVTHTSARNLWASARLFRSDDVQLVGQRDALQRELQQAQQVRSTCRNYRVNEVRKDVMQPGEVAANDTRCGCPLRTAHSSWPARCCSAGAAAGLSGMPGTGHDSKEGPAQPGMVFGRK